MNIGIIGCGYVGSACARYWCNQGYGVTATTTTEARVESLQAILLPSRCAIANSVLLLEGSDRPRLERFVEGLEVILVSVGAKSSQRTAEGYRSTYLETAKTLVEAIASSRTVRQIIYTSSYQIYGNRQGATADETTPVAPVSLTGEILAQTEQVLWNASTPARKVCIFRLGGIYGPGRELIKIYEKRAGTVRPGTGTEATNWIHLEDIVGAIAYGCDHQLSGIYNLVDEAHLTRQQLLDRLFTLHQLPLVTWDSSLPDPSPYNVWVSNQKLKGAGYVFQYGDRQL